MPSGVLDVVRVDRLMQLELLTAVVEFPRVIVGNTPLPELRRRLWVELRRAIEVGQYAPATSLSRNFRMPLETMSAASPARRWT